MFFIDFIIEIYYVTFLGDMQCFVHFFLWANVIKVWPLMQISLLQFFKQIHKFALSEFWVILIISAIFWQK